MANKDFKQIMTNVAIQLLNTRQMGISYAPNWSEEFSRKELSEKFINLTEQLAKIIEEIGGITKLSAEDLASLGFKKWDEDMPNLRLIPIWAYDLIPDGTELTSISGDTIIKQGNNVDLDVRFGCIAWGINI